MPLGPSITHEHEDEGGIQKTNSSPPRISSARYIGMMRPKIDANKCVRLCFLSTVPRISPAKTRHTCQRNGSDYIRTPTEATHVRNKHTHKIRCTVIIKVHSPSRPESYSESVEQKNNYNLNKHSTPLGFNCICQQPTAADGRGVWDDNFRIMSNQQAHVGEVKNNNKTVRAPNACTHTRTRK